MTVISFNYPAVLALFAVAAALIPVAFFIKRFNYIPAFIVAADIIALLIICLIFSIPAIEIVFYLFAVALECLICGILGGKR